MPEKFIKKIIEPTQKTPVLQKNTKTSNFTLNYLIFFIYLRIRDLVVFYPFLTYRI